MQAPPVVARVAATTLLAQGKPAGMERERGERLPCPMMADEDGPGLGRPLRTRFAGALRLWAQMVDPTQDRSGTRLSPFGGDGIRSEAKIEAILASWYRP